MVQVDYDSPEPRSPEQIRALARAYNAESAQLQAAAGIDPAKCLRIGIKSGREQTKFRPYFGALNERLWVSPEDGWVDHDIETHWQGVRELSPKSTDLVVRAAGIGVSYVANPGYDNLEAESMAWAIDFVVDPKMGDLRRYEILARRFGIEPSLAREAHEEQALHLENIRGVAAQGVIP